MDGTLQLIDIPVHNCFAAQSIWLWHHQIHNGIERIYFDLVIKGMSFVGLKKNLKIVVVIDDVILFGEIAPHVRFFEERVYI